jgi:dihydroorotate dehydrogenase electron transfer subunit
LTVLEVEGRKMRSDGNGAAPRSLRELDCEVISNRAIADSYWHLSVSLPSPAPTVMPGQFFQLLCPGQGRGSHLLRRPMSVYRIDGNHGRVEFLYKVVGTGTRALTSLAVGGGINLFGPLGRGFWLEPDWRHVVLLGRGAGLATLAPLAEAALARGIAVTAVLSTARSELAVSVEHLRAAGTEVVIVNDADGSAALERVEPMLRRLTAEHGSNLIATCGSERLLRLVQRLGHELGIAGQVAMEQPMACGIGMCFTCVRPFSVDGKRIMRRICLEGPVFDVQESLAYA